MKLTKLSLVAALAVSTAFAGGDIAPVEPAPMVETSPWTFGGDARLYYDTMITDQAGSPSFFDQASARGQGAASVDIGYAFADTWKINAGVTGLFTLGLDDAVVSGVWLNAGANVPGTTLTSVGDALWIDTLNVTGTMFDGALTTVIGRQELDTPFAFSEQWTIAANTFDAAVAIVKPIDELSLVAAYIYDGNGNGNRVSTFAASPAIAGTGPVNVFGNSAGGFTGSRGYVPFAGADKGAWTVAAIGTFAGVTAQAWYYDVLDLAQATWVQADADFAGFQIGAQYAWMQGDGLISTITDTKGLAGKLGYKMDALNVWGAYSTVADDGFLALGNTATMLNNAGWGGGNGSGQSKLYTEAWWNYGLVSQPGSDSFALAADYNFGDISIVNGVSLMGQYTSISNSTTTGGFTSNFDLDEFTAVAGGTIYGLNVQLAYIWADYSWNTDTATPINYNSDTIQAYLTYQF